MAMIKVSTSVFSTIKTVERALEKATRGDEIQLASGKYRESITINNIVTIYGKNKGEAVLEGLIIIPKSSQVTFKHLTIKPTGQLYVEGEAIFEDCHFSGESTAVNLSLNNGKARLINCTIEHAADVGVALLNDSQATVKNCVFSNNGKAHVLLENSKLTIDNSELSNAKHAFWIKNNSAVEAENVSLHHQSGTQVIVQHDSIFTDKNSRITNGLGNGLYATKNCDISLFNTHLEDHQLPQIWIQNSKLFAKDCEVLRGAESGIMLRELTEATITNCQIALHKIANIQVSAESLLNMTNSTVSQCEGVGIQVREKSIVNISETIFSENVLSQLFITEKAICTIKDTKITKGKQVGLFVEKLASCTIVDSHILENENTGLTVIDSELTVLGCQIKQNKGNGILAANDAKVSVDISHFEKNGMPHIAGKTNVQLQVNDSHFNGGKSIYLLDHSAITLQNSHFEKGEGVKIEVADHTIADIKRCKITEGTGNAVKASRDSTVHIYDSQISKHKLPQIVINDSSLIFKNSELLEGGRNGFIIENNSEAFIQDSFISQHLFPQLWINLESTVELSATQLKGGAESDIYVQNKSIVHATNCIIHNDRFNFNVQAVNHSKIDLFQTSVENTFGEKFYSENNSFITQIVDELN